MDYKNVNDYELMYRIKEKDDEAFEMLFNKYEPIIIGIAKKYSSYTKKYGVEFGDIIQEGRIALVRAINSFDSDSSSLFYTYACICVERQLISYLRNLSANKYKPLNYRVSDDCIYSLTDVRYDPINCLFDKYDADIFIDIKNSLKFLDSNIFELKYNGFSYKEISELLDISLRSVDSRLSRIRKNFRKKENKF